MDSSLPGSSVHGIFQARVLEWVPLPSPICLWLCAKWASLVAQLVKNPLEVQETWVRSLSWDDSPGEVKGYPLLYSGLEISMDCTLHGVAKSRT